MARFIDDPVSVGKAEFERIGTAPRAWERTLRMAEHAANTLEPHAHGGESLQVLGMLTLRPALAAACALRPEVANHWLRPLPHGCRMRPARNWEFFSATNVAVWRALRPSGSNDL